MIIPNRIRVGSTFYTVKSQETPIVNNGLQCYGYCDPNIHEIVLDAGLISDEQTMEQTFCHELIHAMMHERKINLEAWGLTNAQMEHVVDSLGISLHQVLMDNPDITMTAEEFDKKYQTQNENKEEEKVNE